MSVKKFTAGVKAYRQTYWASEYVPLDSDILACFKITPQAGVDHEEAAAAVVAESSTGTWTTVWTDLLTDLVYYKGRAYRIEDVPGDDTCFDCFDVFVAYPTGVGCLGISVNSINSGGNKYDFSRFAKINQLVGIPLGIHGSAGFTDDQLRRMISFGAAKINYCEPLFKVAARRKC